MSIAAMKVLIVDDFATMRRVERALLAQLGVESVDEAADGAAALDLLKTTPFDFVITDIGMPIMNGFELLGAIKAEPSLKHLPVLLVTAEARKDDIVRSLRGGAAGYIVKPFDRAVLEQKLRLNAPRQFASA